MKKVLMWLLGIVVFLALLFLAYFIGSAPELPKGTNDIINNQIDDALASVYYGDTGITDRSGVRIWYESMPPRDSSKAAILLIMGHSMSGIVWSDYFFRPLIDSGYHVVRYDNRGVGLSDWMDDWDSDNAYNLRDMVKDGLAVMDELGIHRFHVVGASMGGMIAQTMAVDHPDRVLSLTSVMSSGNINDPQLPPVPKAFIRNFQKLALRYMIVQNEKNMIRFNVGVSELLKGGDTYESNVRAIANRTLFQMRKRGGYNPNVADQHTTAINRSGSRYEALKSLTVPTLVVHGIGDPLIPIEHAKAYAPLIPGADTLWVDGMGHDIPMIYTDEVHRSMMVLFDRVEDSKTSTKE